MKFSSRHLIIPIVSVIGLLIVNCTQAQRPSRFGNIEARISAETDSLMAILKPTSEQTEAIEAILASRAEKLLAARPQPNSTRDAFREMRNKWTEVENQTTIALTPLLSEAQMEAYQAYMARRQDLQQRRGRRGRVQ